MSDILVFIEHDADGITDLSLQCLAHGKKAADGHGAKLCAIVLGEGVGDVAGQVQSMGTAVTYTADNAALANYLPVPYAKVVSQVIEANGISLCILPSSTVGNDLAPMVAGKLDAPCCLGVTGATCGPEGVTLQRLEFDAKAKTLFKPCAGPMITTLADGIEDQLLPAGGGSGEITAIAVELGPDDLKSCVERREVARKTVNLKDAKVIVGGGAGVGCADNFALLQQLAEKLGGEVGATRAAVDAGWIGAEHQIGQTGVNVRPDLYIACGISGAVQHIVGIREAKQIIAINTDSSAPIFKVAHYKIVGDLSEVVPKLIELI